MQFRRSLCSYTIRSRYREGILNSRQSVVSKNRFGRRYYQVSTSSLIENKGSDGNPTPQVVSRKRRLKDILKNRKTNYDAMSLNVNTTVKDAISHFSREKMSSCIGVCDDGEVAGIFTARDIISFIHKKFPNSNERALSECIEDLLTKKEKIIFCSPEDSVRHCREIMFQHKIRNIPVIRDGRILGIVNLGELSDSTFSVANAGGKKSFMRNVLGRLGLPKGTRVADSANPAPRYAITVSEYALPHPFKKVDGVGARLEPPKQVYMVVADGVGSWRQYGVDPRLYASRLLITDQAGGDLSLFDSEPIHPLDIVVDAWSATDAEEITGSSTICVASIDNATNQLTVTNLGDCGLMVVRHMPFLSQQQLKSFNLPYQLGYSGIPQHQGNFERPSDAKTFSLPVQPGDIVLLATDGLFDNVDLDEIVAEIEEWENNSEQEAMDDLAKTLVMKARELSLDKTKDSPFAVLAKDNDIMWSGGMPDDTTVLCARIYEPKE
eukprot:GSChrysophyteH1.ASY1.ANO1.2843.1 assembled CDS